MNIGPALKVLRAERGWSQRNLAHRGRFSSSYIALMEIGRYSPSIDIVFRLAQAFEMSAAQFVERLESVLKTGEPVSLKATRDLASAETLRVSQQQGEQLLHADTVASSGPNSQMKTARGSEPSGRLGNTCNRS